MHGEVRLYPGAALVPTSSGRIGEGRSRQMRHTVGLLQAHGTKAVLGVDTDAERNHMVWFDLRHPSKHVAQTFRRHIESMYLTALLVINLDAQERWLQFPLNVSPVDLDEVGGQG